MTAPYPSPHDQLRAALANQDEVVLSGCAGTGKTFNVNKLVGPGVVLCAPTAKAALRLEEVCRRKAFTVHSLIYGAPTEAWIRSDGTTCKGWTEDVQCTLCLGAGGTCTRCGGVGTIPFAHPAPGCPGCTCTSRLSFGDVKGLEETTLLVVDEASMVGVRLANDIRATVAKWSAAGSSADHDDFGDPDEPAEPATPTPNIKILWVGDPAQLPPVGDQPGVDLHHADVHLEHVYRAQGGILAMATLVRNATSFQDLNQIIVQAANSEFPDVEIRHDGLAGLADWRAGRSQRMAIVHTNKQRTQANVWVRDTLKRQGPLVRGDRLIVRKNNQAVPVWNGQVYCVDSTHRVDEFTVIRAHLDGVEPQTIIRFVVNEDYLASADKDEFGRDVHKLSDLFRPLAAIHHDERCTFHNGSDVDDCVPECKPGPLAGLRLVNAQHGFVITCHASQGNEANEVGVLWTPFTHGDRFADARSWLYTAVTRARRSLTIWTGR